VDQLALPRDQVGVVAFNSRADLVSELSPSAERIGEAIDGLVSSPGTYIDLGLAAALDELRSPRRDPANGPVIVLLTDGIATDPPAGRSVAAEARAGGITIYTIGLGQDVDTPYLEHLAGSPARYYFAPTAGELADIYRAIARAIPCPPEAFWGRR
jgi:Mg-chelatase subunit ChlD